ncbi:condensin complex subunit 2 [Miscanthus floridulus]|uniref:condensin complex subunit 2 n=1 Tax=Miscanthus floridulus TaxID=154761 RepID=UPI003458DD3F
MSPAEDAPPQTPPPARGTAAGSRVLLQSPPPAFPLGSNDDQQERARARAAARAASVRRRSLAASIAPSKDPRHDLLNREQVMDLFHNCIKLASENKINQKNTWELGLIDHLSEIIQAGADEDEETNFQKASCTLEAGVKIYSLRVDSVHSEAYKVLGGINRAGRGEEADLEEGSNVEPAQDEGINKKDADRRISPASTLESSFEALNVKKFDVAFTVDPLYHQTTAQFDEGGAKGLLLYNLGVYGSCRVLFDSFEAPDKCILSDMQTEQAEAIDLSFAKEQIVEMVTQMRLCNDISPTLRDIVAQFDEENQRPSHRLSPGQMPVMEDPMDDDNEADDNDSMLPDSGTWHFGGCHDHEDAYNENCNPMDSISTNYQEEFNEYTVEIPQGTIVDERLDKIADLLLLGMGSSKANAWAGPEHWKYRKAKDLEAVPTSSGDSEITNKMKKRSKDKPDIDFTKALNNEHPNIFAAPKNPKSLVLPANRAMCSNKLPEDCHYRPESLVKLFLLPDVLCLAKRRRKSLDAPVDNDDDFIPSEPWEDDNFCTDHVDEGYVCSDVEEPVNLINKPRQVNKIDIQYDKVSKQVDVHALKEVLWNHIHASAETDGQEREETESPLRLSQVLHDLPSSNSDAVSTDISPHLYFICLLHLANEHSLKLCDHPTLDEIDIYMPTSPLVK